jgi:hypothetical protein
MWAMQGRQVGRTMTSVATTGDHERGSNRCWLTTTRSSVCSDHVDRLLWAMWVFAAVWGFIVNFRRDDHSGWAKALWAISSS